MRLHVGTLFAGLIYLAVGLVFVTEALGWWTMQAADLRLFGPVALVVAGLAVMASAVGGRRG